MSTASAAAARGAAGRGLGLGLATRLYLAIGGAVALTLVASVVAWFSFLKLGEQQQEITREHLPAITQSLRLAKQSALIAAAVPELLSVADERERLEKMLALQELEDELIILLDTLTTTIGGAEHAIENGRSSLEEVRRDGAEVSRSLASLSQVVGRQIALKAALADRVDEAVELHRQLRERLTPLIDDGTFYLVTGYRELDDAAPVPLSERVDEGALLTFAALGELAAEANLMIGLLAEGSTIPEIALLQPLQERFEASSARFSTALAAVSRIPHAPELERLYRQLNAVGLGDGGIIALRRLILEYDVAARQLVTRNRALTADLTQDVDRIVAAARAGALASVEQTNQAIEFGRSLLIMLNFLAISGAIVIGWLYVRRSFTGPMATLTEAAERFEVGRFTPDILEPTARRSDELGHLARTFTRMASEVQARTDILDRMVAERTQQLNEKNAALEQSLKRIADELEMAKRMQLSILPRHIPQLHDLALYARMRAAREVSGDFYDLIAIDENRVGIVIADVSDKGVPAALLMAVCCTRIKSIAMRGASPGDALAELNDTLSENNDAAMFVTALYGVVDLRSGTFTFANAGHDAPLLLRAGEAVAPLPSTGGIALGLLPNATYDECEVDLQAGDTIFLYTDGITEAFDLAGHAFTAPRLKKILFDSRALSVENLCLSVIENVEKHSENAPQSDDITCVAIRYHPEAVTDAADKPSELVFTMGADLGELARLAEEVERFVEAAELPANLGFQLNLVLDELITNTVHHGGLEAQGSQIGVRMIRQDEEVVVVVDDDAAPFNPLELPPADTDAALEERAIGGLGIHLVKSTMDRLEYERIAGRNRLTMHKRIAA